MLNIDARLGGRSLQRRTTNNLIYSPVDLVELVSKGITLRPGDVVATGTLQGPTHSCKRTRRLDRGQMLVSEISALGTSTNRLILGAAVNGA